MSGRKRRQGRVGKVACKSPLGGVCVLRGSFPFLSLSVSLCLSLSFSVCLVSLGEVRIYGDCRLLRAIA